MNSIKINADKLSRIEESAMSKIRGGSSPDESDGEANDAWCKEHCGAPQGSNNMISTKSKW